MFHIPKEMARIHCKKLDQLKLGSNSKVMSLSGHGKACPYFNGSLILHGATEGS